MRARAMLIAALLGGCTAQQIETSQGAADQSVANARPTIALACWLVSAADAGFQAYAAGSRRDPAVVADEQRAVSAANAICLAPPGDVAQALADVTAAYKSVVAATPPAS